MDVDDGFCLADHDSISAALVAASSETSLNEAKRVYLGEVHSQFQLKAGEVVAEIQTATAESAASEVGLSEEARLLDADKAAQLDKLLEKTAALEESAQLQQCKLNRQR